MSAGDSDARTLDPTVGLDALVRALADRGYRVVGPVVRQAAIAYDEITSADDMPIGCAVEQGAGVWRLRHNDDPTRFGWTPGADSWKRVVFPPEQEVLRIRRTDGSWTASRPLPPDRPLAIVGARDCEIRALEVLDRVLADPDYPDPRYEERRAGTFVVAVSCGVPSATCWCTSMGGGPSPQSGFDVRLTELNDTDGHRLLAEAGSTNGAALLADLPSRPALFADHYAADEVVSRSIGALPVRITGSELPVLLQGTELHPRWDDVGARCLSCSNCTMACPTCFCSSFADATALTTDGSGAVETVRLQHWSSCFQLDHSNLAGRPVRNTTASRYRQWLTHKLQTWPEQFGTAGCVGCGRCTTWCPAAIDIVAEATALIDSTPLATARPS